MPSVLPVSLVGFSRRLWMTEEMSVWSVPSVSFSIMEAMLMISPTL